MTAETHIAKFMNETDLPIMVGAFLQVTEGLNRLEEILVMPNEETIIYSLTGEWFLSNHFDEQEYKDIWINKGLNKIYDIGKFRIQPCISGQYSWMDTDIFNVTFENNVFKFIYKS
jgi:hypothetical protein